MLPRLNVFWKVLTAVAAVALLTAAVALSAYLTGGGWGFLVALTVLFAVAGASVAASWMAAPLRALLSWLSREDSGRLRFTSGDEWQAAAVSLNAWRSEARRRLESANAELDQLRAVLFTMADGVLVVNGARRIQMANPAALSLLGVAKSDAVGRTVIECTMSAPLDEAVRTALESSETATANLDLLFPQTRHIHAVVSASGEGEDRSAVAVLHDITEARRIDQVRRDFVANVSHELRTPVTGIQTIAENLLDGALEEPHVARQFLGHIIQSSRRLVALVDDLLGLARAEARSSAERAARVAVPVAPLARSVVAALDLAIASKDLDVGVDAPDDLYAWADPESLRQILTNLVDNAVKYTPAGGTVDVCAAREEEAVCLRVSDTGIGIAKEHQDRVFERFYRVDRARSRAVGGTGLGLSLVKHLTEGMGGRVSVESEPGRGSTFTVRLPVPPDEPEAAPGEPEAAPGAGPEAEGPADLTVP